MKTHKRKSGDKPKTFLFDGHKLIYHTDRLNQFIQQGDCPPIYIEISPVGVCNHRCVFCAYDFIGHPNRRLETGRLLGLIDELSAAGVRSVLYAGEGEPLLHPDLAKFVERSKRNKIDVGIYSNGHLLTEELASKILPYLTFIRFSFNGGTKDNYSKVHSVRPEVFDKVMGNIRAAVSIKRKKGLDVDIGAQYVLLPENIDNLLDGIKSLKEAGVDYFVIKPFVQQSSSQGYHLKKQFGLGELEEIFEKAEGLSGEGFRVIARMASFAGYGKRAYKHCYGTSFITALNSAGDFATCLPYWHDKKFVFGNIYKNSFEEIWNGEARRRLKGYLEKRLPVAKCPPNCRPHAVNEFLWKIKDQGIRHINFI